MRYRRSAQRRQVHPVQCADQGGHRGGELSLLHHRAERRHRRGARYAHGRAGRRSSSRNACSPPSSSSSTSPVWWRAPPRAKAWATSSSPTSARPMPSSTWCAASTTPTWCTWRARSIRSPTSKSSSPSWRWPTSPWWNAPSSATARKPSPATRTRRSWWQCWSGCCRT